MILVAIGINSCLVVTGSGAYKLSRVNSEFIKPLKSEQFIIATAEYNEKVILGVKEVIFHNNNMFGADKKSEVLKKMVVKIRYGQLYLKDRNNFVFLPTLICSSRQLRRPTHITQIGKSHKQNYRPKFVKEHNFSSQESLLK